MIASFASQASDPSARIGALLLAVAQEFKPVDAVAADAALERLAAAIEPRVGRCGRVEDHAHAILDLVERERFRLAGRVGPDDALLDAVLRRREGHPILIVSICAEVGRRAGLSVAPIRFGDRVLVGVRHDDRALAIDPTGECPCPLRRPTWMCAHEVAFLTLGELARLLALDGRIEEALHAAGLRAELPVSAPVRERVAFEVEALRAQLN